MIPRNQNAKGRRTKTFCSQKSVEWIAIFPARKISNIQLNVGEGRRNRSSRRIDGEERNEYTSTPGVSSQEYAVPNRRQRDNDSEESECKSAPEGCSKGRRPKTFCSQKSVEWIAIFPAWKISNIQLRKKCPPWRECGSSVVERRMKNEILSKSAPEGCSKGRRPKTFCSQKFSRMDCNISSEENFEYPAEKSNGEGTAQRWKDRRCRMVLYKCTKSTLVTRWKRSLTLHDHKGT